MPSYLLPETKDNAEGQLNAGISASATSIILNSGEGAEFPQPITASATSGGNSQTLNSTGIQAAGVVVGDFIENVTDGSHAYVTAVSTDSVTTTTLKGGSDDTWQNSDEWAVKRFIVTLNARDASGNITKSEKVLIKDRSTDTLTVASGGRGYDGSSAQSFDPDDYISLFWVSKTPEGVKAALAELASDIKDLQDTRATTTYVDAAIAGIKFKDSVRAASTASLTLASDVENGDSLDGVSLSTGDRVLLKDQSTASENGVYIVAASGAPTRATDFDSTDEVNSAVVAVREGSANADSSWLQTADDPVIDTNDLTFTAFGGASPVDDTAYGAGWNGDTTNAPSKNVVYDKIESMVFAKRIATDLTGVTVNADASETDILSETIPANSLGTANYLEFEINISEFDLSTSISHDNVVFKLKYGATTITSLSFTEAGGSDMTNLIGTIKGKVYANASTSAQKGVLEAYLSNQQEGGNVNGTIFGKFFGTSSIDSTSSQTLAVTVDFEGTTSTKIVVNSSDVKLITA